jgi:hypothetical protein
MALKKYKPTSPGRRFMSVSTFEEVTKTTPEKSLTEPLKKKGGRNNMGRITTRHQGGGHKRRYRVIDFKRVKDGVPAKVAAIEYDPNRSARIALLHYLDGAAFEAPSTKQAKGLVESWGKDAPLVIVLNDDEETLIKSFRNLPKVLVTVPSELEVATVVWAKSVLISEAALPLVQGRAT